MTTMSEPKKIRCDMNLTASRGAGGCGTAADFIVTTPRNHHPEKSLFACVQHLPKAVRKVTPGDGTDAVIRVMVLTPALIADLVNEPAGA